MNIMNTENNKDIFFPAGTAEVNIIPVMQGEEQMKVESGDLPDTLPILALRNAVLFPGMVYPVTIGRQKSITLIKEAESVTLSSEPSAGGCHGGGADREGSL